MDQRGWGGAHIGRGRYTDERRLTKQHTPEHTQEWSTDLNTEQNLLNKNYNSKMAMREQNRTGSSENQNWTDRTGQAERYMQKVQ